MIDTSLDTTNFYFLLAVIQGLVLATIIIAQPQRNKANLFFGILILLISSSLLHTVLEESIHAFNARFPVPIGYRFAYGPVAYLHVLHIRDPLRSTSRKDWLHFIPSLFFDVILFTSAFVYLGGHKDWAYANLPVIHTIALVVAFIWIMQLASYAYFIYRESVDVRAVLREFDKVKKWLRYLVIGLSAYVSFLFIAIPIGLVFVDRMDDNSALLYKPLGTIGTLCIYGLGYLYLINYSKVVRSYMTKVSKFKFATSELDDKKSEILQAFDRDRVYKDPNITVAKLAGHLGWPINSVSNMINETMHTNFSDLVNRYRVKAFKELVLAPDSQRYSILGIGQEVGFSSKASFYRVFKKETGMTPSEYMKSHA